MRIFDYFMYNIEPSEIQEGSTIICAEMYRRRDAQFYITLCRYRNREVQIKYSGWYWYITIIIGHVKSKKSFSCISENSMKKWLVEIAKDYYKNPHDYNGQTADGGEFIDMLDWELSDDRYDDRFYKIKEY